MATFSINSRTIQEFKKSFTLALNQEENPTEIILEIGNAEKYYFDKGEALLFSETFKDLTSLLIGKVYTQKTDEEKEIPVSTEDLEKQNECLDKMGIPRSNKKAFDNMLRKNLFSKKKEMPTSTEKEEEFLAKMKRRSIKNQEKKISIFTNEDNELLKNMGTTEELPEELVKLIKEQRGRASVEKHLGKEVADKIYGEKEGNFCKTCKVQIYWNDELKK